MPYIVYEVKNNHDLICEDCAEEHYKEEEVNKKELGSLPVGSECSNCGDLFSGK